MSLKNKGVIEIGTKFSKLTVIKDRELLRINGRTIGFYLCKCECGSTKLIRGFDLKNGKTKSCGCGMGKCTHGKHKTKTYRTWAMMKDRCSNPNSPNYARYGGRGITVCKRWETFENFLEDMGEAPKGLSIDRIDNNKGYSKENCRWATKEQQVYNTSRTTRLKLNNETLLIADVAKRIGVSQATIRRWKRSGTLEQHGLIWL